MRNCPYCGKKIVPDASECKHCGKSIGLKKRNDDDDGPGLINLDSWKGRAIPTWVMVLVVGVFVLLTVLMVMEGCNKSNLIDG